MKKIFVFIVIIAVVFTAAAQETAKKLDELVTVWANNEKFNGTVLVAQKGEVLLQKGYGYKNAATKEMNDGNTVFQIGSITKQFTAAIILRLQENKKLSVQDKLSKYFPALPFAQKVTIEHLLSHTSGIYNYTNNADFMKTEAVKPASQEKILALFKDKPLEFEPGGKFSYSNSGYMLLGYIIEKVTGKPYESSVREIIFRPLQMNHSGFDFAALTAPGKATGYFSLSNTANTPATVVDSSVSFAAGAIYTTVGDLYKWDRSLYTEKIITKTSLKDAYTIRKGRYGFGWSIDSAYGKQVYRHGGGIFGFSTFIDRSPEEDICIILFDNKGDGGLEKMAEALNAILHNKPYEIPKEKIAIAVDTAILQQYTGNYELTPAFVLAITVDDGKLMIQPTGQGKSALYAEKENLFFSKIVDAQIEFIKDADGNTGKLILHQNGRDMPAKKINPNEPRQLPKERIAIAIDTAVVRQYVGAYELAPNFILTISLEDGKLMVQATGQEKSAMYAEKENLFFSKIVDAQVEFTKGADGKTDKLILHQNGQHIPAKKIK